MKLIHMELLQQRTKKTMHSNAKWHTSNGSSVKARRLILVSTRESGTRKFINERIVFPYVNGK